MWMGKRMSKRHHSRTGHLEEKNKKNQKSFWEKQSIYSEKTNSNKNKTNEENNVSNIEGHINNINEERRDRPNPSRHNSYNYNHYSSPNQSNCCNSKNYYHKHCPSRQRQHLRC